MNEYDNRITLLDCGMTKITLEGVEYVLDAEQGVGRGGTCLVYHAQQTEPKGEPRKVILKEFYPIHRDCGSFRKREDGSLRLPEKPGIAFKKDRFEYAYEMFKTLFNKAELNQYVVQAQCYPRDNGTVYIVVDYSSGITLEEYMGQNNSLYDFFFRMKTLAGVLQKLHTMGYIHMDIKPGNFLCFDNGVMKLMDTDSLIHKRAFKQNGVQLAVSCSRGYAAPEVEKLVENPDDDVASRRSRRQMMKQGETADQFSFGAMVYRFIFGTPPAAPYVQDSPYESRLAQKLEDIYPEIPGKAVRLIRELLRKLLANHPCNRYPSMEAVEQTIDKILPLVNPEEVRLAETFCPNPEPIIGREKKAAELREKMLQQSPRGSRIVFVTGMGGVGKSVLARDYGERYAGEYDVISEVSASSAAEAMCSIKIHHLEPDETLPLQERTDKCKEKIINLCRKYRTLIIVNDYDTSDDPGSRIWQELGCDLILTSRHDWSKSEFPVVTVSCGDLSPEEVPAAAEEIFTRYYLQGAQTEPDRARRKGYLEAESGELQQLLQRIDYHPLSIKFMARYMAYLPGEELHPSQALKELTGEFFGEDSLVEFQNRKDGGITRDNAYGHLSRIFRQALQNNRFHKGDLEALRYMTLIPSAYGIGTRRFSNWLGVKAAHLERLKDQGWLEYLPRRQDPLEQEEHRGVYVMPTILQQILRKEPGMEVTFGDILGYLQWLGYSVVSNQRYVQKKAALTHLEMLLLMPEEVSKAYILFLCRIYVAYTTMLDTHAAVNIGQKLLALYDRLPRQEQEDPDLVQSVAAIRLGVQMLRGTVTNEDELISAVEGSPNYLINLSLKQRLRFDRGIMDDALRVMNINQMQDWRKVRPEEKVAFWSNYCYMDIRAGRPKGAETCFLNASGTYWSELYRKKDARLDPLFFETASYYGEVRLQSDCSDKTLTWLHQIHTAAKEIMGEKNIYVGRLTNLLAEAYHMRSEPELAASYREQACAATDITVDKAEYMMHLALDHRDLGTGKDREFLEASLKLYGVLMKEISPGDTVETEEDLSSVYYCDALWQIEHNAAALGFELLDRWLRLVFRRYGYCTYTAAHYTAVGSLYYWFGLWAKSGHCDRFVKQCLKRQSEEPVSEKHLQFRPHHPWFRQWVEDNIGERYIQLEEWMKANRLQKML